MKPLGWCLLVLGLVIGPVVQAPASPLVQDNQSNQAVPKDPSRLGSLTKVPHSTGFYFATMNHAAVFEAVADSNAWKAIKKSEVARGMKSAYRRGRTKGYAEYNENNPFAQYLKFYGDTFDNFIVKSGWEVASQVIGNEMFIYVDNDMADLIKVTRDAQKKAFQFMADEVDFNDLESQELGDEIAVQMVTNMLKELTDVACPTMIIGSRLEDPDEFKGMLELLRSGAEAGMNDLPPEIDFLRDGWKVIDKEGNYFLTLNLDLSVLPLDDLLADVDDAELVAAIEEFVLNKQGTIGLGITGNLLMLGIASDAKKLTEFGSQNRLIDLPQLARLNESIQKNEPIIGAYYISEEYAKAQFSFAEAIEAYLPMFEKGFVTGITKNLESDVPQAQLEQLSTEISKFMRELATDLKTVFPQPALGYGFAKLDADGIRGHAFSEFRHPALDGSKPLDLANHAGPQTILLAAVRPRDLAEQYGLLSKWSSRLYETLKHEAFQQALESIGKTKPADSSGGAPDLMEDEPKLESPDLESADEKLATEVAAAMRKDFESFTSKFDQTTRQRLLPAISGQEFGLFIELVEGPESWHPEIPKTETRLSLPLPALIMRHSNQADLVLATEEYSDQLTSLFESVKAKVPEKDRQEIESELEQWDFDLEKTKIDAGTLFQFSLPPELEVDALVRPGFLIANNNIVASLLQKHAEDLSQPRTPDLFGPAAEKKPSSMIFFYDNRVVMKGIETWNELALEFAEEAALEQDITFDLSQYEAERDTLQFSEEQLKDYVQHYWNLSNCWKGFSARSFDDGAGRASEFLLKFSDIEPVK